MTALEPATFAIEDNASIFCALEILGTESIDNMLILSFSHILSASGFVAGLKNDMNVCADDNLEISS